MAQAVDMSATGTGGQPATHEHKTLLRFITCGSVDDGKSTLIGRLLYDAKMLYDDQLATLESDSKKMGTQGESLDFALLLDGLKAEREQGITIDVAYRFFATAARKFIAADTPGHEQYTRNMVTGASTADAAVLMVDARKGILTQTRRHSHLVSLIGIRNIVVAINKMDMVNYSERTFNAIANEYGAFAESLGFANITYVPLSALKGDNVTERSANTPWYAGTSLLGFLETVEVGEDRLQRAPFRLPVQWVNRPNPDFRGYAGTISSGVIRVRDLICVQPSGRLSTVARIVSGDGDLALAFAGQSVTLTLADEIDISRGDIISSADVPPACADQFEATIIWMHDEPMLPGRRYVFKLGSATAHAQVTEIKHQLDINTMAQLAAKQLALNAIGVCNLSLDRGIAFDPYAENRDTGGFILIDPISNHTVGAGMLHFALHRAQNIRLQRVDVDKAARSALKRQKPCALWFTGLSGAGKSTIANLVEQKLLALGRHTYPLDGDNVRHGLNRDLGFTPADRVENIRRIGEVMRLMVDAGLIVLAAFISPYRAERRVARDLVQDGEFIEIFIDTPLHVAEARDPKGLYKKARRGELKNFTGIDAPYEAPENPEIRIDTTALTADEAAEQIVTSLRRLGILAVVEN